MASIYDELDIEGARFLNKVYPDLASNSQVLHAEKRKKNKDEDVAIYMRRLEISSNFVNDKYKLKELKHFYYDEYLAKEGNLPNTIKIDSQIVSLDKKAAIKIQEKSLDKWLDYLFDVNTKYPMWTKYWVFHGMLKIGTFNEATGTYQKRSKKTIAPFIELNIHVLDRCIDYITKYVREKKISDKRLQDLIESGNFQKLYTTLIIDEKRNLVNGCDCRGKWITYYHEGEDDVYDKENLGIEPEYLKLYNSLQGYNTGWCTANDKMTAKEQICGGSSYLGGDFHVYYTDDSDGLCRKPRIAIRMENNKILEIRGIQDGQNLEDGLEEIVYDKLKTLGLSIKEQERYSNIIFNTRMLTTLSKKMRNNEPFTLEDLKFIYECDNVITGFGYQKDQRVLKIIKARDKKEDLKKFSKEELINSIKNSGNYFLIQYIDSKLEDYEEICIELIKYNIVAVKYVSPTISCYEKICMGIVRENGLFLEYVSLEANNYEQICMSAVKENGLALEFVPSTVSNYEELCMIGVKEDVRALQFVSRTVSNYEEICLEVLKKPLWFLAFEYIAPTVSFYEKICMSVVKINPLLLKHIPATTNNYEQICMDAIRYSEGAALEFVHPSASNYDELCMLSLSYDGMLLKHILPSVNNYDNLCKFGVNKNGLALQFVSPTVSNYDELCMLGVMKNGLALKDVFWTVNNYEEICMVAVKENSMAKYMISENARSYEEMCMSRVKENGLALKDVSSVALNYEELCEEAVKENELSIQFVLPTARNYNELIKRLEKIIKESSSVKKVINKYMPTDYLEQFHVACKIGGAVDKLNRKKVDGLVHR